MFKPVSGKPDHAQTEERILEFWEREGIFQKLVKKNQGRPPFRFIDGPITANNPNGMGVHHAWGRTYKDIYQRVKAMKGRDQRYQNGFDCQGLWVEVEVEQELGLNSKRDILDYGLDKFSQKCRQRVDTCAEAVVGASKRLGQWMDWENSYFTYTDANIEYIWHFLKKCHENGWLYVGHTCMPWCPRCGTSLSQHELLDAYKDLTHDAVYLALPIKERENEHILVWTTTPWTLAANTAVAINPELTYLKVKQEGRVLYVSEGAGSALEGDHEVLGKLSGKELVGLRYQGPFDELEAQEGSDHRIIPWKEVSETEGTGIVHIAPGCGQEDFKLSQEFDLQVVAPLDDAGVYVEGFGELSGQFAGNVAQMVFDSLKEKGYLYKTEKYTHRYPTCWRCGEELVFRLVDEWFIRCDEIRPLMLEAARQVRWIPAHVGKLMEDWLNNMRDWCISRKRFWGLPLPFYRCSCGELVIVGSRAELEKLAVSGLEGLRELHRPWIDEVKIKCSRCGEEVSRITEVGDCWLDAGIVPFSTLRYLDKDKSYWQKWFPVDLICEMREQVRLWFYSVLFMGVTLEGVCPYETVVAYEKMLDEEGRAMHKSAGNAIWFDEAVERMGADVMRWIYARQGLSANLRFGYRVADEVRRKMLTLRNVYSFFVTYGNLDRPELGGPLKLEELSGLDRWLLARLNMLVREVNEALENYDLAKVTGDLAEHFFEDLSNWYVRRSRRRFWKSTSDEDKQAAYRTLYEALTTLVKLLAPIIPFTCEEMYQNLVRAIDPEVPESVHLCDYPQAVPAFADEKLIEDMHFIMEVTRLGHSARSEQGIKVRQPLAELLVLAHDNAPVEALRNFEKEILEELNVKKLTIVEDESELDARENLALASHRGVQVALDVRIDDALRSEGLIRDVVRRVQNMRKQADFQVEDRIVLFYQAEGFVQKALQEHLDYLKAETLSVEAHESPAPEDAFRREFTLADDAIDIGIQRVANKTQD